jgi:hypothetical protein
MHPPTDFRQFPFALSPIQDCGRYNGRISYWRLYAIENALRIIAHSVLITQYPRDWVSQTVSRKKYGEIEFRKADYRSQPAVSSPGAHDVYYLSLSDLTKIVANHADLFKRAIPYLDIDNWIVRLERVRLPRNLVAHMNWPNANDRVEIETAYREMRSLNRLLMSSGFALQVP